MKLRPSVLGLSLLWGVIGCGGAAGENAAAVAPSASAPSTSANQPSGSASATGAPTALGPEKSAPTSATEPPPSTAAATDVGRAAAEPSSAGHQGKEGAATSVGKSVTPAKTASNKGTTKAAASAGEAPAPSSAPHSFDCGDKGQKPCPMQGWMKANMAPAAASGDATELAKQFDYLAAHAPPGLSNWSAIAKTGAARARASDLDGAKGACKSCHDQYKGKYKLELRDRAL